MRGRTSSPDAGALLDLGPQGAPLELLIELARDERPVRLAERLRRYDALLERGWREVPRFAHAGSPPAVVFVARGYRDVERLLRAADGAAGASARSRLIFCAEPDMHRRALRAWMLPPETPDRRGSDELHRDGDRPAHLTPPSRRTAFERTHDRAHDDGHRPAYVTLPFRRRTSSACTVA